MARSANPPTAATLCHVAVIESDSRDLPNPSPPGYSESVVTERGILIYEYEMQSSSTIAVTRPNPNLYRYAFNDFKLSGKARLTEDTRELTCNGFFLLQELT